MTEDSKEPLQAAANNMKKVIELLDRLDTALKKKRDSRNE